MNEMDERYLMTTEKLSTKLDDGNEIWTYPAVHVYKGTLPQDVLDELLVYLDETDNNDANSRLVANVSGTQDTLGFKDDPMSKYTNIMMQSVCQYIDQCQFKAYLSHGENTGCTIEISDAWSVKMSSGDYNPLHFHQSNSINGLSSICFIKVPTQINESINRLDSSGSEDYISHNQNHDGFLQLVWGASIPSDFKAVEQAWVCPKPGDFYIFPKTLQHQVAPYRGDGERWSLNMNYDVWKENEKIKTVDEVE